LADARQSAPLTQIAVHDSSVLIDLANGDLLEAYLRLGYTTRTTDLIVHEVAKDSKPIAGWLRTHATIVGYGPDELLALKQRQLAQAPGISLPDASVLYLAQTVDALLLTNDKLLRKEAGRLDIPAAGTLFLMDALHTEGVLSGKDLDHSLSAILAEGARLPPAACAERRERWR
jgi:predicted nucleic acid-binding protein